jgi:hypothetical protein
LLLAFVEYYVEVLEIPPKKKGQQITSSAVPSLKNG